MNTITLLEHVIANPQNVQRLSTRRTMTFLKPKSSLSFNIVMLRKFIEIFQTEDKKRDAADRCITSKIPGGISSPDYDTVLNFLKKHCDGANSTALAQLVLSTAIEFIRQNPGSLWHEFMMLRQLRETLKFKGSADYETQIDSREQEVIQNILRMHHLLEQEKPNFPQILRFITDQEISLEAKKAALIALSCHQISAASIEGGRFNSRAHDRKNFRALLNVSNIDNIDAGTSQSLNSISLATMPPGILPPGRIQTFGEGSSFMIAQPKNLGAHWESFFADLENADSLVSLMTKIVKTNYSNKSHKTDDSSLVDWFDTVKEYCQAHSEHSEEFSIAHKNYADLYHVLLTHKILPKDAPLPIAAEALDEDEIEAASQALLSSSAQESGAKRKKSNSLHFSSTSRTKTAGQLGAIAEESDEEDRSPAKKSKGSNRSFLSASHLTHSGQATLDSLAHHDAANEDDDVSQLSANDVDDSDDDMLPSQSQFAMNIIMLIKNYYAQDKSEIDKFTIAREIVNSVLTWQGSAPCAVPASRAVNMLKTSLTELTITLDKIYNPLYNIFYTVVVSASAAEIQSKATLQYYHDASAALILMNEWTLSGKLVAHTYSTEVKDSAGNLPIQNLIHRTSKQFGKEIIGEALRKQPFLWWDLLYKTINADVLQDERFQKEALCVLLLTEILRKSPEDLSIEERGLVVYAIRACVRNDFKSPFYNAMFVLAATYNGTRLAEVAIVQLSSEELSGRMAQLCTHFFEHIRLQPEDEAYVDTLSDQQKVIYNNMQAFLDLYNVQSGHVEIEDFDPETMSVNSCLTGQSKKTGFSLSSSYTFRSTDSRKSSSSHYSRGSAFSQQVMAKGAAVFWTQLFTSTKPLDKATVKFILKGFYAASLIDALDKELIVDLLRRAFDWLHALPLTRVQAASHWATKFSSTQSARIECVASENWKGLMRYLAIQGNEKTFVEYCAYQVEVEKLNTYEIDFMIENIKILHADCFMEKLWTEVLAVIGERLDARLSALEKSKKLTSSQVEPYQKMLFNQDGTMIDFPLKSKSVVERVNALLAKATPEAASNSVLGKRK